MMMEAHKSEPSICFNLDCMEGMKAFPDKLFDLAVVDRPHLKLLTAVGHDSTIYAIEKTSTFDRSAADILVTDLGISADEIAAMFHQEELSYEEAVQSLNFIVRNCISELVGYGLNFYELQ